MGLSKDEGKFTGLLSLISSLEINTFSNFLKRKILSNFPHQEILKLVLFLAYSPTCQFNQLLDVFDISPSKQRSFSDIQLKLILKTLMKCSHGEITLTDSRERISKFLNNYPLSKDGLIFYRRILKKDLKIKIDVEIINSVFPNLIYLPVDFQLAINYDPGNMFEFPVLIEPLYNGVRLKMFATPDGKSGAVTRGLINYNSLFKSHLEILKQLSQKMESIIELDGEVISEDWLQTARIMDQSLYKEIDPVEASKITFQIFDVVILKRKKLSLLRRKKIYGSKIVSKMIDIYPPVKLIPHKTVNDQTELLDCYNKALQKNFNGIMIKDPNAPYYEGRKSGWVRMEGIKRVNLPVVGLIDDHHALCEYNNYCLSIPIQNGFQLSDVQERLRERKTIFGEFITRDGDRNFQFIAWRQDKAVTI